MEEDKKKIKLLVCCHKADPYIRTEEPYVPIQVGKELHPDLDLGFINDNEGDNISEKNLSWCELTAIYWGWKNIRDTEYLGLCHYRRYFDIDFNKIDIDKLMAGKDIIVAKGKKQLSKSERSKNLIFYTCQEDFYLYIDTFLTIYPDIEKTLVKYFYNSRDSYSYNMFIAKKELYDEYCEFVFPVFFELEKRLKKHGYWRTNRAIAYFGEWSLGLFVFYKNLKVKRVPITRWDDVSKIKKIFFDIRYEIWRLLYYLIDIFVLVPKKIRIPYYVLTGFAQDGIILKGLKTDEP